MTVSSRYLSTITTVKICNLCLFFRQCLPLRCDLTLSSFHRINDLSPSYGPYQFLYFASYPYLCSFSDVHVFIPILHVIPSQYNLRSFHPARIFCTFSYICIQTPSSIAIAHGSSPRMYARMYARMYVQVVEVKYKYIEVKSDFRAS